MAEIGDDGSVEYRVPHDGLISENLATPPTTIHAPERGVAVDHELSTLDSQASLHTLSNTEIVVIEQPPLPLSTSAKVVPLHSDMISKPYAEPNWNNVNKKVKEKYAAERKRADNAVKEAQWQNKELNTLRVEAHNYVKTSQAFMKNQQKKLGNVSRKAIVYGNGVAVRKNEINDLKKKITKLGRS